MDTDEHHSPTLRCSSSSPSFNSDTDDSSSSDGHQRRPVWGLPDHCNNQKRFRRQLSMRETSLEAAWEKRRRRHIKKSCLGRRSFDLQAVRGVVTDEDLAELKGCIDLGFGFNEEEGGQGLCDTLPALDLYFAVNRQLGLSGSQASSPLGSPRSPNPPDSWKICSPGDDPQDVKTRLRHWAQVVACSARQCS